MTRRQIAACRRFERRLTRVAIGLAGMLVVVMLVPVVAGWIAR